MQGFCVCSSNTGALWVICNDGYIVSASEQLECESLRMTLLSILDTLKDFDMYLDNTCGRLGGGVKISADNVCQEV
eukprot:677147-Pelagomonas_calceolata.AAC.2